MSEREIEGDPAFPIYYQSARWVSENGKEDTGGGYFMFEEYPDDSELTESLTKMMDAYRERVGVQRVLHLEAEYKLHETWCLSWFQHWTFDRGQTNQEAIASFRRYVDRHADYQRDRLDTGSKEGLKEKLGHDPICLMGAEDRWRWCGTEDGTTDTRTEPPCRCEHCKEQGVIRIGH